MKKFVIALVISLICIMSLNLLIYGNVYTLETLSNSIFIIGIIMFFYGLLIITNAWKIFRVVNYGLSSVIKRKKFKYKTFYDYVIDKESDEHIPFTLEILILSIIYLVISFVFAEIVLDARNQDVLLIMIKFVKIILV